ncbi:hypothetical protein HBH70_148400 [Parastagonospora nodorum]|nr:hypothetical protein HBH52_090340 [Parastagonospora nodorum]KAH4125869.1 hypothetical protein HBH47_052890 [Parastagonospora nodorum]KAH4201013.1 hypothetical protein HBH42_023520 [Parastagonospora nodorum]KAH4262557.1 hypothetical protein HBI03_111540 [Parastagonospora nodorum]KAH4281116.1 hypothetical protein HBI04_053050 [Parastagonospora nodorum]
MIDIRQSTALFNQSTYINMSVLNPPPAQSEVTLETAVIQADTVEAQALAFTATINALPTFAGVWDLDETKDEFPTSTTFIPHKNPGQESVMEGDGRTPVDPEEFAVGGKYSSILKLFINYENLPNNSYAHGTGWLIRPDLMVTAGHNVYSWRRTNVRLPGRAREIKAYADYNGAKNISDASLNSASSRPRDFALVQFYRPFTDVTPFQYIETPATADLQLRVAGYPADLKDQETGERGGKMYELFEETKSDITANSDRMLAHYIDSEGGNSGGPVLRRHDLVALGTHVYGGGDFNTASVS